MGSGHDSGRQSQRGPGVMLTGVSVPSVGTVGASGTLPGTLSAVLEMTSGTGCHTVF